MTDMTLFNAIDLGVPVTREPCAGTVVEDREGVRWRADIRLAGAPGHAGRDRQFIPIWTGRSSAVVGEVRTDEEMREHMPLTVVRIDRVFAGPEALAARLAGEADDARALDAPEEAQPASPPR